MLTELAFKSPNRRPAEASDAGVRSANMTKSCKSLPGSSDDALLINASSAVCNMADHSLRAFDAEKATAERATSEPKHIICTKLKREGKSTSPSVTPKELALALFKVVLAVMQISTFQPSRLAEVTAAARNAAP
jgi:hypothetical protein